VPAFITGRTGGTREQGKGSECCGHMAKAHGDPLETSG
jgi:hypothetical protein